MRDATTSGPREAFYLAEAQRLAHTGSWAFTAAGFTHWSPELFAIHGLPPGGTAPSIAAYLALVHPDDREHVTQVIQKMLADHAAFDFTKRIVRPDGTIRHVRCVGVPSTDGEGFVGTGIDVTEQEELTAALRKSETEIRQILDLAPQIIGVLGPRRERLYANRVALACSDIDDRRRTEERMRNETIALREDLDRASMFEEIVGSSPALQNVLAQVAKVAQTDSTVLILGETGTGKELLARAIHKRSRRASGAFIPVNCAAIPPSLIASELFGHEKGAFTGALQRRLGRFEAADGGTIFLDEIGELPQ